MTLAGTLSRRRHHVDRPAGGIGRPPDDRGALVVGLLVGRGHVNRARAAGTAAEAIDNGVAGNVGDLPLGGGRIDDQHVRTARVRVGDVEVILGRLGLSDLDDHVDIAVSVLIRPAGDLLGDFEHRGADL